MRAGNAASSFRPQLPERVTQVKWHTVDRSHGREPSRRKNLPQTVAIYRFLHPCFRFWACDLSILPSKPVHVSEANAFYRNFVSSRGRFFLSLRSNRREKRTNRLRDRAVTLSECLRICDCTWRSFVTVTRLLFIKMFLRPGFSSNFLRDRVIAISYVCFCDLRELYT